VTADITRLPLRHDWVNGIERRLAACDSADGNGRTEKTCALCGLVKVTVHYPQGLPGREWITASGEVWVGNATPPCIPKIPSEVPFT
jgi:hypothetical protein